MTLLLKIWTVLVLTGFASAELAVPKSVHLFHISRSKDTQTIQYELNLDEDGSIVKHNPVKIYWLRPTKKTNSEPLTWIQNKYAYGVKITEQGPQSLSFHFVSYPSKTLKVTRSPDGDFKVFTPCQGREIELDKIFIQIDGGSFWMPTITSVELSGVDSRTGEPKKETIQPSVK